MQSEWVSYFMRSLLSEGWLVYETVEKTQEGLRSRRFDKEGPTGLITTTTAVSLHPENETRYFSLRVSDSRNQTKQIMAAEAHRVSGKTGAHTDYEAELTRAVALQNWLSYTDARVIVPFAEAISDLIPPVAVRLRRDFRAVLSLVMAHALLHQKTRKRDKKGRVIATLRDYAAVRKLIRPVIAEAAEQSVPKSVRETVEAVRELLKGRRSDELGKSASVTTREIAERLGLDRSAAYRRVRDAEHRGYLENAEQIRKGRLMRVLLGDPLPDHDRRQSCLQSRRFFGA
jgi:ribosomal protein S25